MDDSANDLTRALRQQREIEDAAIEKGPAGDGLRAQLQEQRRREDDDRESLGRTNGMTK